MITFPNAKINLGLNIVSKRPDGYHNIETIFYPIPVKDALEFVETDRTETEMHVSNITVDGDVTSNLVYKAYQLLSKDFLLPKLSICLQKNIPFGAGLGGGSSDAAFMLKMLNSHYDLGLSNSDLERYAIQLGADCPFFIDNKPVFASGKGEVFESVDFSLSGYYLVLVKPEINVSTQDAYRNCNPSIPEMSLKEIIKRPIDEWKLIMKNDFEDSVFEKYPVIAEIKKNLYEKGAVYASMSGSGASVFGLFSKPVDLKNNFDDCYFWSGELN